MKRKIRSEEDIPVKLHLDGIDYFNDFLTKLSLRIMKRCCLKAGFVANDIDEFIEIHWDHKYNRPGFKNHIYRPTTG
jgi:hypothetical protein